ncbi:MAG: DUF433 domain-containing protein [Isosphaeraceae bacterium]
MNEPRELIERLPDCLHWSPDGEIRIAGHRIGLYHLIVHYAEGNTPEMLLCQFPTVPLVVIHKVIVFYLENRQAVDRYIAEYRAELDELAAHGRHAPSLAAMHARFEDRQKAVTTGADWV